MSEIEKVNTGARDVVKEQEKMENEIRKDVARDFGNLPPEAQEAIIQSRLGILTNSEKPELNRVDMGENASRNWKEKLFE